MIAKYSTLLTKPAFTLVVLVIAGYHIFGSLIWKDAPKLDASAIGLLLLAAIPWLSSMISKAELPGGVKVEFRELQKKQEIQSQELEALRFIILHFLSEDELKILEKLELKSYVIPIGFAPYDAQFLIEQVQRLKNLKLIEASQNDRGVRTLKKDIDLHSAPNGPTNQPVNVCEHFQITDTGKQFLKLKKETQK